MSQWLINIYKGFRVLIGYWGFARISDVEPLYPLSYIPRRTTIDGRDLPLSQPWCRSMSLLKRVWRDCGRWTAEMPFLFYPQIGDPGWVQSSSRYSREVAWSIPLILDRTALDLISNFKLNLFLKLSSVWSQSTVPIIWLRTARLHLIQIPNWNLFR